MRRALLGAAAVLLALFVLLEVNYPRLSPQSQLAIFALLGLVSCFLSFPLHARVAERGWARALDWLLVVATVLVCTYVVVQTEPATRSLWIDGQSLGDRAGAEAPLDHLVGLVGLLLVLEATRRCVGWALPILSVLFLLYARFGSAMPDALFPHRGYPWERIVSQTFLHSQGVFGIALNVMFTYVFLFVLFGAFLEATGAIGAILGVARKLFRRARGGEAKVAVIGSGLMGSLSGSAVANTATTGTFTIPLMRSGGFPPHVAAGVEAAASSGGALVPPVMGAGAYMMLEIVTPPVTYLEIIRAALLPAILYYLSLFLIVHFTSRRLAALGVEATSASSEGEKARPEVPRGEGSVWAGVLFVVGLASLLVLLLMGYTVFRAVTLALILVVGLSLVRPETRLDRRQTIAAVRRAAAGGVPLIAAAACVGIIIGVVTLTGIGTKLPATILPLAENNLSAALALLMVSSLILGMGLPSAVCYLLLATLVGPVLGNLGVVPLAAHLFIFYFGMMAMVTPPVALAAYAAGSIANADVMRSSFAAFRFALAGFTLPYLFVFRPELLLMSADGGPAAASKVALAVAAGATGILALAAGIAGYLVAPTNRLERVLLLAAAVLLLYPGGADVAGAATLAMVAGIQWRRSDRRATSN